LDINTFGKNGNALHYAINMNDTIVIPTLLNRQDLDINARDKQGNTALHISIINNRLDIVSMLLSRQDIDINAKGENGYFPLDQATLQQNSNIIELLLKHGAQETKITIEDVNRKLISLENMIKNMEKNIKQILELLSKNEEIEIEETDFKISKSSKEETDS